MSFYLLKSFRQLLWDSCKASHPGDSIHKYLLNMPLKTLQQIKSYTFFFFLEIKITFIFNYSECLSRSRSCYYRNHTVLEQAYLKRCSYRKLIHTLNQSVKLISVMVSSWFVTYEEIARTMAAVRASGLIDYITSGSFLPVLSIRCWQIKYWLFSPYRTVSHYWIIISASSLRIHSTCPYSRRSISTLNFD